MRRASHPRSILYCCKTAFIAIALLAPHTGLQAQELKVRYKAGAQQGFLVLRSLAGAMLATGEITQISYQDRVKLHVSFHFRDGSIDDETTVYSQRDTFRLISDRLVQKGKTFPNPCDIRIDVGAQQVSIRAFSKGKPVVKTESMELPSGLSNGMLFNMVQNLQHDAPNVEVPYLSPGAKPRMVKLEIAPEAEEQFKVGGRSYTAQKFIVKVNIGGLAGVVAPMIGKQPPDTYVWVTKGSAPTVIRVQGALYTEGPVWNIQVASPTW